MPESKSLLARAGLRDSPLPVRRIDTTEIPEDYRYFRSSVEAFAHFDVSENPNIRKIDIGNSGQYGWGRTFLFWAFSVARFEKTENPPTVSDIRKAGLVRCFVVWTPWRTHGKPTGWKTFPSKILPGFTAWRKTCFSVLDESGRYYENWQKSARYARRKALEHVSNGELRIREVGTEEFAREYGTASVSHDFKKAFVQALRIIPQKHSDWFRTYLAEDSSGKCVGWAAFVDYLKTCSLYYCAFLSERWKKLNAWTGLIDRWFSDSAKLGLRYLDFWHLRSDDEEKDRTGYSDFKKRIADYQLDFDSIWWKWFP